MKLSNIVILRSYAALNSIEPLTEAAKGVHGIAKAIRLLRGHVEDIDSTRKKAAVDAFGEGVQPDPKHEKWKQYETACLELDKIEVEVGEPHRFVMADLNLAKNKIAPSVLAEVSFLISDF